MASAWYVKGKRVILDGTVNLTSDTIKVLLVTSAYTFDADHDFANDVSGSEPAVAGYTGGFAGSGRKTLASKAFTTVAGSSGYATFGAASVVWTALGPGATLGGAILLKEVTNDAASPVLAFLDPTDLVLNGGDVTLAPSGGVFLKFGP